MENENRVLDVENLQVSFHTYAGEVKAVRGVSFHVDKGETLAFVGESGCGKTATAKAIMRLWKPPFSEIKKDSTILFNGENVLDMDKKRLQSLRGNEISMIFQEPMTSLNPTMTVGKQIMEGLRLHRGLNKQEARKEALRMLEMVRIPDPEKNIDSYPHQLSGGMRQRVMIAMALACDPTILIADEPTTALDVTIQAQILDLLQELKEKTRTAIILVSHDLGVIASFADRVQVMYAGQIVERGLTKDIFENAKHPYTWALLSSVPSLARENKQELYALQGTPPDLVLPLHHCPFAPRCEYCMEICKEQMPPETPVEEGHSVCCWLRHPDAPQVESFYDRRKQL